MYDKSRLTFCDALKTKLLREAGDLASVTWLDRLWSYCRLKGSNLLPNPAFGSCIKQAAAEQQKPKRIKYAT